MRKISTLKNHVFAIMLVIAALTQTTRLDAQCPNNNTYYTDLSTFFDGDESFVTCNWGSEYCTATVCAGVSYYITTAGTLWDTQITLYSSTGTYLAYNDDGTGDEYNTSTLTWTSTFDGSIRIVVNEYDCMTNQECAILSVTQIGECGVGGCVFLDMQYLYNGCNGEFENVTFYPYFSGGCTVSMLSLYSDTFGWEDFDLSLYNLQSGDDITFDLGLPNTDYFYYITLSDGTISDTYIYTTGNCSAVACEFTNVFEDYIGCDGTSETVEFTPFFTGGCTVEAIEFYTTALGYEYIDLQADGFISGDAIGINLGLDNTIYEYQVYLSDGTLSPIYTYTTGTCDVVACNFTNVLASYQGCEGTAEYVDFYAYFTGGCTVETLYLFSSELGWETLDLSAMAYTSGEAIGILLGLDNTTYTYYFELSDGTTSQNFTYTTDVCDVVTTCSNLFIDYTDTGCINPGTGDVPSGDITAFYNGACSVEGIYTSVNGGPYEYLDLSAYGLLSGDPIGLFFNVQNANYTVYYVLSDGSASPTTTFTTEECNSGETICDCAGTQLPIEATAWLGDLSLDDGSFNWNGDPSLPVDFNCATWGFDCGDELEPGFFAYDPYGVCSGEIPPSNGCVDEFCYTIDLDVVTDCHPEDINVYVFNSNGDLVFTAGNADFIVDADFVYTFQMCLPADCYLFQITDEFGDGLNGGDCTTIGYAGIYDYDQSAYVVLAQGDAYLDVYSGEFCVGPQTVCTNLELAITQADCYPASTGELLPVLNYTFDFSGPCTVASLFFSENGGEFTELDVSANGWISGDEGSLFYLTPNTEYTLYYTTNDGASSYLYNYSVGNCLNEITICDCNGTQLSIGVTDWLGDGFADNNFYQWAGEYVNFNCATWGYDCGDIEGAPSFDPFNVCDGQLPPFNGCIETVEVLGCTDPTAINYNPDATINDGSCIYNLQVGCTDSDACNYNDLAIIDNGSCEYISCVGCTDDTASNYDPTATVDDGSCIYVEIEGCTNPLALNFDPLATTDDGSCIFTCIWPTVAYDSHCSPGDLMNFYVDIDLTALGNGAPYTITNSYNNQQQVMNLMGSVVMGPFPNNTPVVIQVTSNTIDCLLTSQPLSEDCDVIGAIYGCTDQDALNYNPEATIDDGSCIYVSVKEVEEQYFMMYPNPARDQITISNNGNSPVVNIRLLDNTGRLVKSEQLVITKGNNHVMNVSELAQGNYTVEILTEGNVEHHNLIIQK